MRHEPQSSGRTLLKHTCPRASFHRPLSLFLRLVPVTVQQHMGFAGAVFPHVLLMLLAPEALCRLKLTASEFFRCPAMH